MIGIYKIKNKINNKIYIGQSLNIKRRIAEHKTPNAKGNNKLHNDIQELGVDNFEFEILEICNKDKLNEREQYYIKKLNPYYNKVGKKRTLEERKNISLGTKKWFDSLPEERKQEIYKNNLKGPKVGHSVSEKTREKLRQATIKQLSQKCKILETGEIFESVKELEKYLGACTGTCAAYWKGKIKSVKGYHIEKCRD